MHRIRPVLTAPAPGVALPSAIERLAIHCSSRLILRLGAARNAFVSASQASIPPSWLRVSQGLLVLDEAPFAGELQLELHELTELTYSSWGQLIIEAQQPLAHLRLNLRGAGRLDFSGSVDELEVRLAGSGTASLVGDARQMRVHASSSGDLQAWDLRCHDLALVASGSGRCAVWAEDQLHVQVLGCGEVVYRGWPRLRIEGLKSGRLINANWNRFAATPAAY